MLTMIATVTGIFVLAALAEALVEYLIKPIVDAADATADGESPAWRDLTLRYTAALVGVLLCVLYRADLLYYFDLYPPWPWVGYVITGLLIGRGSNFVHDFASRWLASD